ncbi:isoleucine--tRNA ligase [bacterium]|nr:isoleucine--tRNA ligase [candidate division CSSED10-310 bacterium]
MEYKDTLRLPQTDFPMRGNLPEKEPRILEKWYSQDLYGQICEARKSAPVYVLHDGPPYANGHIHMGTALNKVLKDIVVKFKTMSGFRAPYLPGWDCHGLPIEHNVMKELGESAKAMSNIDIRAECAAYAERFVAVMREEFKRLGGLGEWEKPYLTMSHSYEATIVDEFQKILLSDRLYQGNKPVHWCCSCKTALAEAEVEYHDHSSHSIWVKFPIISDLGKSIPELRGVSHVSVIIWTTTPWTLPSNLAVAFHPTLDYVAVETGNDVYIVAESLLKETAEICGFQPDRILVRFKGAVLEGHRAQHPFYDRESKLVLANYVTFETGTGCVHTAPGHGQEDFETGLRYGLDIYNPVGNDGRFVDDLPLFGGMHVFDANSAVITHIRDNGSLLASNKVTHSYPHCWRCKNPVIFRATRQWFISIDRQNLRQKSLEEIKRVQWIPWWGQERIAGMIENRPDWCVSRQRTWGVPITVFCCRKCGAVLKNEEVSRNLVHMVREHGVDIWWTASDQDLLHGARCATCSNDTFDREQDIVDVWFESGVSHRAVLTSENGLRWPADLYLEGSDQHRGWFNSSLITAVANYDRAPYDTVLTHGFVVDGEGKKMSKSLGNVLAPENIMRKNGADILRLWIASEDYTDDIRISEEILARMSEMYRRIRNTARFMLGVLADFDPQTHGMAINQLTSFDQYIMHCWEKTKETVTDAYRRFSFHNAIKPLHQFCILDLSGRFLDISKDRFYSNLENDPSRRSGQTVTYLIIHEMTRLLAPILAFTAEEIWQSIPGTHGSIHLESIPGSCPDRLNPELADDWQDVMEMRNAAAVDLEEARRQKLIGHSLDARLTITLSPAQAVNAERIGNEQLAEMFIVSQVDIAVDPSIESPSDIRFTVAPAAGSKCERCWRYDTRIGDADDHPTLCPRCVNVIRNMSR